MAFFGSGTPISKIITDAFPVYLASAARMGLAALALMPFVLIARRTSGTDGLGIDRRDLVTIGAIALVGMFGFSLFMLFGMKEISGAIGGIVMATTPAVTAAGSVLFLRDSLDRWKALAIALAVGGVAAVNVGGAGGGATGDVLLGSALVFGAVIGEAAYTLLGKRVTANISPPVVAAIAAAMAFALFAPLAVSDLAGFDAATPSASEWLALIWWGLGTMALGSLLWYQGVQRVSGTTASAFMGVMPVSALVLSYILLGESFEWIHLVGMAAVLAGIASVTWSERDAS